MMLSFVVSVYSFACLTISLTCMFLGLWSASLAKEQAHDSQMPCFSLLFSAVTLMLLELVFVFHPLFDLYPFCKRCATQFY